MPGRWDYPSCKRCGAKRTKRRHISRRGLCSTCGEVAVKDSITQLRDGHGQYHDRWAENITAGLSRYLGEKAAN